LRPTGAPTPEKLLMLIMHELHHVLLGHTRLFPRLTQIDNLVFDVARLAKYTIP
jgi:hypothetical protein